MCSDFPNQRSMESVAEELFALENEWEGIHRRVRSIRTYVKIPGIYRKVDFLAASQELRNLRERLEELGSVTDLHDSDDKLRRLQDYWIALRTGVRLLQEVCELRAEGVSAAERRAVKEYDKKAGRYVKVRTLVRTLRKKVQI